MQVNNLNCNAPSKQDQAFGMAFKPNTKNMTTKEIQVLTDFLKNTSIDAKSHDIFISMKKQGNTHTFHTTVAKPMNFLKRVFKRPTKFEPEFRYSHKIDSGAQEMAECLENNVSSALDNYKGNNRDEDIKKLIQALHDNKRGKKPTKINSH